MFVLCLTRSRAAFASSLHFEVWPMQAHRCAQVGDVSIALGTLWSFRRSLRLAALCYELLSANSFSYGSFLRNACDNWRAVVIWVASCEMHELTGGRSSGRSPLAKCMDCLAYDRVRSGSPLSACVGVYGTPSLARLVHEYMSD
jgi:hypothetical protein